jgi:hypothetical protein
MIGVGRIFQMYRRRQLTADDEVALIFSPLDYTHSEPLVNMRFALNAAARAGVIDGRQRRQLATRARPTFPNDPGRAWLTRGVVPPGVLEPVRRFVTAGDFNLKRADALRLLVTARRMLERGDRSVEDRHRG